jgi:hypothetical protein
MKKDVAIFTIVKNESYFLPIWIKHYSKFFKKEDIYILDHQSNDGSTNNLDVNVVPVINELAFDHQWLVDTVENFQKKLLEEYTCVIFVESDELLYSINIPFTELIGKFISSNETHITCTAHEIIEVIGKEKQLLPDDSIIDNRNYWFRYPIYDKTLISKIPLIWTWGFHDVRNVPKNTNPDLFMCHLHRCDFEMMLKRHEERAKKWNLKNDGVSGFQHKIGDRDGVLKYFKDIPSIPTEIPSIHKVALYGI